MQIVDRFLPPAMLEDLGKLRRGRVLVGAAFIFAIAVAIGLALRLAIAEHSPAAIAIAVACMALFGAIPWILRTTRAFEKTAILLIAGLFLLVAGTGWFVGGLDGPILVAALLIPFIATFLLGDRAGITTVLLMLAAFALFAVLPSWGIVDLKAPISGRPETLARTVMLILTITGAGLLAVLYEEQRVETEERLRRSESIYRRVFQQTQEIVALSTPQGRLLDLNDAGLRFFGIHSRDEMAQRDVSNSYADPEEREALLERLNADGFVQDYETTHQTPAGLRIVRGTTSTVRDDDGAIEFLLAILRDVTDQRRADDEREALLSQLANKNEELEAFTYAVSHDLKSPLATVRGFLHQLEKQAIAGNLDKTRQYVAPIDRAIDKMSRMLEDLLELSRIGRIAFEPVDLSLSEVAQEALELVAGRIHETGTQVEVTPRLPRVHGDRKLFLAVFQNLIDNAVKFSALRSQPRVWIETRNGDQPPVVAVRDNGIGIPPKFQKKVFGVFQQLSPEAGGTGIGLASVKRAIEVHGGRVWIESDGENAGSTFCFTVPTLAFPRSDVNDG